MNISMIASRFTAFIKKRDFRNDDQHFRNSMK
jgi:hypothetical protein